MVKINPVTSPLFRIYMWTDDTKQNMISKYNNVEAPIVRVINMKRTQTMMQPDQVIFTFALADPLTGILDPQYHNMQDAFNKGSYYEVFVGYDLAPLPAPYASLPKSRIWANGYVQDIQKTATKGAQFTVTGASAIIWLANFRNLNSLEMDFKTDDKTKADYKKSYQHVMYALNGLDGSGGEGRPGIPQGPGMKGILTGTGWFAKFNNKGQGERAIRLMPGYGDSWLTGWETVLTNLQTLAQHYNVFFREDPSVLNLGHQGQIEFGYLGDPSGVTIYGGKELDNLVGNYKSKSGQVRTGANALDAQQLHSTGVSIIQAVQFEDKMDKIINLVWPIGAGSNDTMVTIAPFFHPVESQSHNNKGERINAVNANYALTSLNYNWIQLDSNQNAYIQAPAQYVTGTGDPVGKHDYYWKFQPGGNRVYYLMKGLYIGGRYYPGLVPGWDTQNDPTKPGYTGPNVYYQLVAAQNQDGSYAYGVMELNSYFKYGIYEYTLVDKKNHDPYLLLSAAIGAADNNAEAVPSWTIPVKHPIDPKSGLPAPTVGTGGGRTNFLKIGQQLDIQFTGYVYETIQQNVDGQWYGMGQPYTYLHFPNKKDIGTVVNGLTIDQHMFDKICRIIEIEEQWTGQAYDVTYTMGQGKWRKRHWADTIAKRFENQLTAPPRPYPNRHLKRTTFDGIPMIFEFGATPDAKDGVIYLPSSGSQDGTDTTHPGAIAVTDIQHDHFFDDGHKVSFTVLVENPRCVVDFWFHKPITHHLADINVDPNDAYGIFRLGFSDPNHNKTNSSGKKSGFYVCKTSSDGSINNEIKVGLTHGPHNTIYGPLVPYNEYNVTLQWHSGTHKAMITDKSKRGSKGQKWEAIATWHDEGGPYGEPLLVDTENGKPVKINGAYQSQFGAIGWRCFGADGSARAKVYNLDVHPLRDSKTVSTAAEVSPNGQQVTGRTLVPPQGGTSVVEYGPGEEQGKNSSKTLTATMGGATWTLNKMLVGTYEATVFITNSLVAGTSPAIMFDYPILNGAQRNGLPLAVMPSNKGGNLQFTLASDPSSLDGGHSEAITIPADYSSPPYILDNGNPADPYVIGINIPAYMTLENSYTVQQGLSNPNTNPSLRWEHSMSGSKQYNKFLDGKKSFTEIGTGTILKEKGWAHVLETDSGAKFIIMPDGRIAWAGSHQTDEKGGLMNFQPTAIQGEHIAKGFDGHGLSVFGAFQAQSPSQMVYMYGEGGTTPLGTIDANNPNFHYQDGGANEPDGLVYGAPFNTRGDNTSANSMNASWIYYDINDSTTGDSDEFLQLTTGGTISGQTLTTILYQDCRLYNSPDINGKLRPRKINVQHDITVHTPVYIEPAAFNQVGTVPKTLGAEVTISKAVPAGSNSIPVQEDVTAIVYAAGDTWTVNPLQDEIANPTQNTEDVTLTGVDTKNNAILIQNPLSSPHLIGEPVLQDTYMGQNVTSGGRFTTTRRLGDIIPPADAIGIGYLVEFRAVSPTPVGGGGTYTIVTNPPNTNSTTAINDYSINPNVPMRFMINYGSPDAEIVAPTSYTLENPSQPFGSGNHVTGFTANFAQAHSAGMTITYARWVRGWFGNSGWKAPYTKDSTTVNQAITDGGTSPTYAVPISSTRSMKYLGSLSNAADILAGDWADLYFKASEIGLFNNKSRALTIVGVEMSIHTPANVTPFTAMFEAHSTGTAKPGKQVGSDTIKQGALNYFHKHPKGFGDSHFHSDIYFWAQKDSSPLDRNDNKYYVKWEHDTGDGDSAAHVRTHAARKHDYLVFAGPRADGQGGGVSEDEPNWGIPAMPLIKGGSTISVGIFKSGVNDGNNNQSSLNNVKGSWVVFNSNSSGFALRDTGVVGNQVWIPGYNKCSSTLQVVDQTHITVPSSDIKQWSNYLSNANNSGGIYPAQALVTKGAATGDPQVVVITGVDTSTNTITITAPVTSLVNNQQIIGQTLGFGVVSKHFDWSAKPHNGAVLTGPHQDLFKVGQIGEIPDPHTGEIPINALGNHGKKSAKSHRKGSHPPKLAHQSATHHQNHHNLAYSLDSRNRSPNNSTQSTFHAKKMHPGNTQAQIELHSGKLIGALPVVSGVQQSVYINQVNPHDYIVYDTGSKTGYSPGFYAYTTSGQNKGWYTGSSMPNPARYAGQGGNASPINQGRCYTNGSFDVHRDDASGFIFVGRVSELANSHNHQYHLQTKQPASQKINSTNIHKKTVSRAGVHANQPHKKKRHKKKVSQFAGSKKKHSIVRNR